MCNVCTSFVCGLLCAFFICTINAIPITIVVEQFPSSDADDLPLRFQISKIIDHIMTLNESGTEEKNTVGEYLCKSMATILTTSKGTDAFKSVMAEIKKLANDPEARHITGKISTALQLCHSLKITEDDTQLLRKSSENAIFEINERVFPIGSDNTWKMEPDSNTEEYPAVLVNFDKNMLINLLQRHGTWKDNLESGSEHINVSRDLTGLDEFEGLIPDYENISDKDEYKKKIMGKGTRVRFLPTFEINKKPKQNATKSLGKKLFLFDNGSPKHIADDILGRKIFLFNGNLKESTDTTAKKNEGEKKHFLFDNDPFADKQRIDLNMIDFRNWSNGHDHQKKDTDVDTE